MKDAVVEPEEVLFETRFDYLFPELATDPAAHLPADDPAKIAAVVAGLKALGDAMVEDSLAPGEGPRCLLRHKPIDDLSGYLFCFPAP